MLTKIERDVIIKQMALEGQSQKVVKDRLASLGYDVSRQRIEQLFRRLGVKQQNTEIKEQKARDRLMTKLHDKAGTFKLEDMNDMKFVSAKHKFVTKKNAALQAGLLFTLEFGDLVWPDVCPVLGIPLDYTASGRSENSVSFDQIDPGKGYVPGNVMVMSWRANRIKNDGSAEEHRRIAEFMELDFEEVFNGIEGRLVKQRQEEKDNWEHYLSREFLVQDKPAYSDFIERDGQKREWLNNRNQEKERKKEINDLLQQGLKACSFCGQVKALSEFYPDKRHYSGYGSYCKECKKEQRKHSSQKG
jgi:hypothetical protein